MRDIQQNTVSRAEQVYIDTKDSAGTKVLGGGVLAVGAAAAIYVGKGAAAEALAVLGIGVMVNNSRSTSYSPNVPSNVTSRSPSQQGMINEMIKWSSLKDLQQKHLDNGGSFSNMPQSLSSSISGLQINQQTPICEQFVGNTVDKFFLLNKFRLWAFLLMPGSLVTGQLAFRMTL
ncbi:hypothetical protein [Neosynechococcus sphagnicola]|nr:hypothetical protein [Neosynechococcus sphagnicola]